MDAVPKALLGYEAILGVVLVSLAIAAQQTTYSAIRLRSDLKAFIRTDGRAVVEDPVEGKHFRLGGSEYKFIVHLAHSGNAPTAHRAVAEVDSSWTQESSQQFLSWLGNRGLLVQGDAPPPKQSPPLRQGRQRNDPLFFRLSFGSPEAWTSVVSSHLTPLLGGGGRCCALLLFIVAALGFINQWPQFSASYEYLLSHRGAFTLAICGLLLKVLHELGHCVACHQFGGRVREWGVLVICGAPLLFVDASESRRFPSRRSRLLVSLAGVLAESIVVASSVAVAMILDSPAAYYVAAHLVLTLGMSALIFNLNPLMKFDGYYVLADCLGVDNLYSRGSEYVRRLGVRVFLGRRTCTKSLMPLWVRVYGLASFGWRTLAIAGIGCITIRTLHGLGALLVAWSVWRIWGQSVPQFLQSTESPVQNSSEARPAHAGFVRLLAIVAVMVVFVCYLPVPWQTTIYSTVEYNPPSVVRSPVNAFVEAVHIVDNQTVNAGDLLLTLRSDSLSERLAKLELACLRHEQRLRSAHSRQDMHELKSAQSDLLAARELRLQARDAVESLEVRSPSAGVVTARNLDQLTGTYLAEGCEIAAVGREDSKRLRALVDAESSKVFHEGQRIRYLTPSGESGEATVATVLPRATRQAENSSLGAHRGGPLEVEVDDSGSAEFSESLTPVLIKLEPQQSLSARVGQRVTVSLGSRRTIAAWLWGMVKI